MRYMCVLITPPTNDSADRQQRRVTPENTLTVVDGYAEHRGDLLLQIDELRARLAQLEMRTRRSRTRWNDVTSSADRECPLSDQTLADQT
jgi:hypothetical protein